MAKIVAEQSRETTLEWRQIGVWLDTKLCKALGQDGKRIGDSERLTVNINAIATRSDPFSGVGRDERIATESRMRKGAVEKEQMRAGGKTLRHIPRIWGWVQLFD